MVQTPTDVFACPATPVPTVNTVRPFQAQSLNTTGDHHPINPFFIYFMTQINQSLIDLLELLVLITTYIDLLPTQAYW